MYVATRYVTILPDDANYPRYGGPETVVSAAGAPVACVSRYVERYVPRPIYHTAPGAHLDARARRGFGWMPFEF